MFCWVVSLLAWSRIQRKLDEQQVCEQQMSGAGIVPQPSVRVYVLE